MRSAHGRLGLALAGAAGLLAGSLLPAIREAARPRTEALRDLVQGPGTVLVPASGTAPEQRARHRAAEASAPLVVDLHYWGGTERGWSGSDGRLDSAVAARGWNFIRPALTGPNRHPQACCSPAVIDGIQAAIGYARANGPVQQGAVYVVGASGGGYTALCALLARGMVEADGFVAWNPVTDLEAFHRQNLGRPAADDILACTGSGPRLDAQAARARSPLFRPVPGGLPPVTLFAGVHDGHGPGEGVLPSHAVRMFNRLAREGGHGASALPEGAILALLETRAGTEASGPGPGGRPLHLMREAGSATLVLFEGGHEMLVGPTMAAIDRMRALAKPAGRGL